MILIDLRGYSLIWLNKKDSKGNKEKWYDNLNMDLQNHVLLVICELVDFKKEVSNLCDY
jgi:hypothetical protein